MLNSYFADEEHVKTKVSTEAPGATGDTVKVTCDTMVQNLQRWMWWSLNSV